MFNNAITCTHDHATLKFNFKQKLSEQRMLYFEVSYKLQSYNNMNVIDAQCFGCFAEFKLYIADFEASSSQYDVFTISADLFTIQ